MKKFFKFIFIVFLIFLTPVVLFGALGYLAIRYNFWPPTCSVFPIKQPRRVCEFAQLDKAKAGQDAHYVFWVTVPYTTTSPDGITLLIDGKEPLPLSKINDVTYQGDVVLKTGEDIRYSYRRDNNDISPEFVVHISRVERTVYDAVPYWEHDRTQPNLPENFEWGVGMMDTWTINYNFNLFENTRWNLEESMRRAKKLGATRFDVYSFLEMFGTKENFVMQPVDSAFKYMRDASITFADMKMITTLAKKYDLAVTLRYNVEADYTQYFNVKDVWNVAGMGIGGDAAERRAGDDFGRDDPKTKEYLDRLFDQLQTNLVTWATQAEAAGIAGIDVTPEYRFPSPSPYAAYADEKYVELISAIREVYQGKIYATSFNYFGALQGIARPKYIDYVDGLHLIVGKLDDFRERTTIAQMKVAYKKDLDIFERDYRTYGKPIYLDVSIGSYDRFASGKAGMEFSDFKEVQEAGYQQDWQEQADAYEALFQALDGRTFFSGIMTRGYWYDDFMAPQYMDPANNLMGTIRNKPAEAVWKKWAGK